MSFYTKYSKAKQGWNLIIGTGDNREVVDVYHHVDGFACAEQVATVAESITNEPVYFCVGDQYQAMLEITEPCNNFVQFMAGVTDTYNGEG